MCLDLGAAAGGFTRVLLESGAARVYAVDAGFGQLLGSLRQDPRVVNLEATNVAALDTHLIPEPIEVVTIDVSYLALAAAVAQLDRITIVPGADLIGLVKPMFELRLARPRWIRRPSTPPRRAPWQASPRPAGRSSPSCRRPSWEGEGRLRPWSTPGDHRDVTGSLAVPRACYIPSPTPVRAPQSRTARYGPHLPGLP